MNIKSFITNLFKADHIRYQGVPPINIYAMRLFFGLMFVFVGMDSWRVILNHVGPWKPLSAVAFSVWASYSTLSFLGIIHTLRMLPIMIFMVFYKTLWLIMVAYPLWITGQLAGSEAEEMTMVFIWVVIPIAFIPWRYVFRTYVWNYKTKNQSVHAHQSNLVERH